MSAKEPKNTTLKFFVLNISGGFFVCGSAVYGSGLTLALFGRNEDFYLCFNQASDEKTNPSTQG